MNDPVLLLIAALFLPVFPLSMGFNLVLARLRHSVLRSMVLLAWPQIGVLILTGSATTPPHWLLIPVLLTSALYAFRAIALREVGQWTGFLATSLWALLWLGVINGTSPALLHVHALGMSLPLVLLTWLQAGLEQRFDVAYTDLYGGLAQSLPRFAGVLVCVVLTITATPLSPVFFSMLILIVDSTAVQPAAAVILLVIWLLWSWAGIRLLQGLVVGPPYADSVADLGLTATWVMAVLLMMLAAGGLYVLGGTL